MAVGIEYESHEYQPIIRSTIYFHYRLKAILTNDTSEHSEMELYSPTQP